MVVVEVTVEVSLVVETALTVTVETGVAVMMNVVVVVEVETELLVFTLLWQELLFSGIHNMAMLPTHVDTS